MHETSFVVYVCTAAVWIQYFCELSSRMMSSIFVGSTRAIQISTVMYVFFNLMQSSYFNLCVSACVDTGIIVPPLRYISLPVQMYIILSCAHARVSLEELYARWSSCARNDRKMWWYAPARGSIGKYAAPRRRFEYGLLELRESFGEAFVHSATVARQSHFESQTFVLLHSVNVFVSFCDMSLYYFRFASTCSPAFDILSIYSQFGVHLLRDCRKWVLIEICLELFWNGCVRACNFCR